MGIIYILTLLPVVASIFKGLVIVKFIQSLSALHEGELATEANFLFCIRPSVQGAGRPGQKVLNPCNF